MEEKEGKEGKSEGSNKEKEENKKGKVKLGPYVLVTRVLSAHLRNKQTKGRIKEEKEEEEVKV